MNSIKIATLGLCAAAVVSCGNNTGNGALIGAGGGAVLGAIIGKIAGNTAVGAAIGTAVGTGAGALIGKHMDKVKAEAEAELNNAKVEEVTDVNGLKAVKITFDSGLLFKTSSSELSSASKTNLDNLAKLMKKYSTCAIDAYGHTDNQGWRNSTAEQSAQKNLELSQQRAQSVVDYLKVAGVANSQFKNVVGKGSSEPVADNSTKAGQDQNRRVEIYMYASEQMVKEAQQGKLN
ncbi:MAG TPA: hypothetical protein DEQ27_01720 [Prevotella sp.]|nr:hypothetical protein [Prevotella sp.]